MTKFRVNVHVDAKKYIFFDLNDKELQKKYYLCTRINT